jgi:preprotein translocase subunit SecY
LSSIFRNGREVLNRPDVRRRLLVTLLVLVAWRALAQLVVPGADPALLPQKDVSVLALGLTAYVNALIIVVLVRVISTTARNQGDRARQWTRWLTPALALGQAYGLTTLWQYEQPPVLPTHLDWFTRLAIMAAMAAGTTLLMWLGEILDEHGLGFGCGVLLLYVLDIGVRHVGRIATMIGEGMTGPTLSALAPAVAWALSTMALVVLTVFVLQAVRRVPIEIPAGGRRRRAAPSVERTFLPIRLLMTGVLLPTFMANGVIAAPAIVAGYLEPVPQQWIKTYWQPTGPNVLADAVYVTAHMLLVIALVYFLLTIYGNARGIASNLKLHSARIPGVPAGEPTARYLGRILTRLTLIGALFLALAVAVVPVVAAWATPTPRSEAHFNAFGLVLLVAVLLRAARAAARPQSAVPAADSGDWLP